MRFACFDRWNEPKPDPTGVTEAKWTSGVDGTRSLELTSVGETNVGKGDRIVFTDPRGHLQETIVVSPEHRREDTRIITSLVCKGGIQELDDTFIEDKRNRSATATQCLRKALEGTRWTIGMVDDADTLADLGFYHISALEAVESIAAKYGLEITSGYLMDPQHQRITDRAVNLVKAQGDQSNEGLRRFEYGHDLKGVTRTVDATGVKTRLYGYGKGLPPTKTASKPAATDGASTSATSTTANPTSKTLKPPNSGDCPARPRQAWVQTCSRAAGSSAPSATDGCSARTRRSSTRW